ncbi:hypothetical protein L3049_10665 [Labilibaculum sp. DW002]|uniref:Uncharacterized protein n=1 Tax=Paralabilibaculum antarcticum TaxID=2912572 RepID=A0ABT5VT58_9BACT|nr:hypothetical protein [Labilibaculum sp. DW002]MDE5418471.1 hypothetical protein [Labilibaculum sp. DW002]
MEISKSLTQTLKKSELTGLIVDNSEVVLDAACSDEIIKAIPVFSDIYKVYSVVSTVRASLFQKQMYAFLFELKDIKPQKRETLLKKLDSKEGENQSLGEELIVMLEQFSNVRKSTIYARLFRHLLLENIDKETFKRFAHILNQIFEGDIQNLISFYTDEPISEYSQIALENLGLITIERRSTKYIKALGSFNGKIIEKPKQNELGKLFFDLISETTK